MILYEYHKIIMFWGYLKSCEAGLGEGLENDFGFEKKLGTSRFFILCCTVVQDLNSIYDVRKKKRDIPEIKASNSSERIKKYVLLRLSKLPINIYVTVIDKTKIYKGTKLREKPSTYMYNYGLRFILERLFLNYKTEEISLILDGRANKMYELDIEAYIKHLMNDGRLTTREFKIKEIDSRTDPALSCADFPAWAIKAKYEDKNLYFYNIIKRKIVFEKLFPK